MSTFRPRQMGIVHDVIEGQVLIIRSDSGAYYSMEGTGTVVWEGILRGESVDAITASAVQRYPDTPELAADIRYLFADLQREQLIEETTSASSPGTTTSASSPGTTTSTPWPDTWTAPALAIFNDMKDLLLFDPIHEVGPEGWPYASHE